MKLRISMLIVSASVVLGTLGFVLSSSSARSSSHAVNAEAAGRATSRYRIRPAESHFMVRAYSGGLLWFMGHGHHVAVRDFGGEADVTSGTLTPASLRMTVKAGSLEETGRVFTEQQRQMINNSMRNEVLEVEKYPEMTFNSTNVSAKKTGDNEFKAKIAGDFTLHGVTRQVVIPARVLLNGNILHATGEFSVNRSDFNVKTHSVKWGTIRVRNRVKFVFDIVAARI
jgi:polyisoprenoid-binding protein YceI